MSYSLASASRHIAWIVCAFGIAVPQWSPLAAQSKVARPLTAAEIPSRFNPPKTVESQPPLHIGSQIQLLVDDHLLSDWWRLRRFQYPIRKYAGNPILQADQVWEETARRSAGTMPTAAVYDVDEGLFKLWYQIEQETGGNVIGYAESRDGLSFKKPHLGLIEYGGTWSNNVCRVEPYGKPVWGAIHLVRDARPRLPERKFWAVGLPHWRDGRSRIRRWEGVAYSADGKTWHMAPGGILGGAGGGNPSCVWDERIGRYVVFHRQLYETADRGRYIVRQESTDLIHWTPRQTVFNPMGGRWPEVESMMVFRHRGVYFGLPQMLDNDRTGEVEVHLIVSRDGLSWEQPFPTKPFIPRGAPGDFDDMITWFPQAVVHGKRIYFYYGGARYPHNIRNPRELSPRLRTNKIGVAWVPLDRLIGLRADRDPGSFLTKPILIEGNDLWVNADVADELVAEVLPTTIPLTLYTLRDEEGNIRYHEFEGSGDAFPGYSFHDCAAVSGDSNQHRITWKGGRLGRFKGKSVRLRIRARHSTIYACQVR